MLSPHRELSIMAVFKNKNRLASAIAAIALIALVLLLAGSAGFWLYNPPRFDSVLSFCTLNILQGSAEVQTPDTIAWEEARDGMKLEPGSRVITADGSHVLLTFSEGTTTKLEPGTDLVVTKLESNRENYPNVIMLRQQSGGTWNQVAKLPDKKRHFEVQTPSAAVLARGTLFLVNVDASGKTFIQTTEGQVDVTAQNRKVHVFAGQQTEAALGAPPSMPMPIPPPDNELIVTVSTPAVGLVIDPHGSRTGYLPNGSALNQIAGSRSSVGEESRHTTVIPKLSSGEYTVVLHGVDEGKADYSIEALGDGKNKFKYVGSYDATTGSEWELRLQVNVIGGLLQRVSIVDPDSRVGKAIGDNDGAGAQATEVRPREPVTNSLDIDEQWPSAWTKERQLGYWLALAIIIILLVVGTIYVRLCRWC